MASKFENGGSHTESRFKRMVRRFKPAGRVAVGGLLAVEIAGGAAVATAADQRPAAIVTEGQMPSFQSVVVFPGGEQPTVQVGPEVSAAEWVNPIRVESAEQAAQLFGADAYSQDPNNWKVNEFGGATLKPDQAGFTHRVNTNGAVVEGWIKINKPGENQAQTLVSRPRDVNKLDINGGTFWRAPKGKEKELWAQVRRAVIAKEADPITGQPDVDVVPVCLPGEDPNRSVTPARIKSRVKAAQTWGRDKWSRNPNNWRLHKDGSATLKEDPSGLEHEVRTNGAVLTGWNKIDRVSGFDASPFVASQVRELYAKGVTVYLPKPGDAIALHYQLYKQTVKREADPIKGQPGTIVNSYCN